MSDAATYSATATQEETEGNDIMAHVVAIVAPHFMAVPPLPFTPAELTKLKHLLEQIEAKFDLAAMNHKSAADKYKDDAKYHDAGLEYRQAGKDAMQVAQINIACNEMTEAKKYVQMAYDLAEDESLAFSQSYTSTSDAGDRHAADDATQKRKDISAKYGPGGTARTNFALK